jgi:hypothetical protein
MISLSRVGFSKNRRFAIFYTEVERDGEGNGMFYFAKKEGDAWEFEIHPDFAWSWRT